MSGWKRPRRPLVAGVEGVAAFPEWEGDVGPALDDAVARLWDAHWAARVTAPFSWDLFTEWWAARRWVEPRDVRKS